ncbi:TerB family tellurite resistance protein [Mesorhizobium sp. BR1-1-6]|uniref:tellurite resistance TerB family protein n=1 Tax=Mesorhizobium sp. BR1-1-6 TaxID=2876648 RepID=UPI001CD11A62|nr:TerB family tellurite resistance protein [Mesorhizobium sp. BR1-1-6]MBZ9893141.1 TerB family tellurite resistance protein [Mesorhizobium sp. BR1-1-6]
MFERVLSFLRDLPTGTGASASADDPRVAASALLYHVMSADGVRQDVEWERFKAVLAQAYSVSGNELDALAAAGERADNEAIDLYAFTSVLKRHLDAEGRKAFIGLMWEIVYADGELHELEDNTVWRVAELIGVERQDRIEARRKAAAAAPGARGTSSDE